MAILVGAGARHAAADVIDIAETLNAGVAKALLGKAVLPDDLPYVTGQIGLLGTKVSYELMRDCDTLLMIGSTFPYGEFLPKEGQAKGVQIDIDPKALSLRYPMDVALVGDAALTLKALRPLLDNKPAGAWRATVEKNTMAWREEEDARAHLAADPVNPELFFWELSRHLSSNALLAADTGMSTAFFARALQMRKGMKTAVSGTLATMGPAISYATAAKFAYPERPAFAFVGDGAMQMLGLNALITVSKYWKRWADPRFIAAMLNNRDLNRVTCELRGLGGAPKVPETQDVPDMDYVRYVELFGLMGMRIDRPEDVETVCAVALGAKRPAVIDVRADPNVVALPPHATLEQTTKFFASLVKGDVDRLAVLKQLAKQLAL